MSKCRQVVIIVLVVYLISLGWLLFFYEDSHYSRLTDESITHNLTPFKTIRHYVFVIFQTHHGFAIKSSAAVNLLGNVLLFFPLGILLPVAFPLYNNVITAFIMVVAICSVELLQWIFSIGVFDIDDIILNVAGCLMGLFFSFPYRGTNERR